MEGGGKRAKPTYGATFHRPSGKVIKISGVGKKEYDFKDFVPYCRYEMEPNGAKRYSTYLRHKKEVCIICIAHFSFTSGVQAWNYLLRFMDTSQPLPDLPIHEENRHQDPLTKRYDQRIGRDPNYWRSKNIKEINAISKQEFKKAQAWIENRKQQIEASQGDLKILNELTRENRVLVPE